MSALAGRRSATLLSALGLLTMLVAGCAVGYGYDDYGGVGGGYYAPSGYGRGYGGWGPGYSVGPYRGGGFGRGRAGFGGPRGIPSIPSGRRGGGGFRGGGGPHGGGPHGGGGRGGGGRGGGGRGH